MSTQTGGRKADRHSALAGSDPGKEAEEDDCREDGEPRTWHRMLRVREHKTSIVRGTWWKLPSCYGFSKEGSRVVAPRGLVSRVGGLGGTGRVGGEMREDCPKPDLERVSGERSRMNSPHHPAGIHEHGG